MTNVEMVKWAGLDELLVDDERIKKLIWRARLQGREDAFAQMAAFANQLSDAEKLASYPGGFLKRQKND